MFILKVFAALVISFNAWAQLPNCSANTGLQGTIDRFCPSVEGVPLEGCCPTIKNPNFPNGKMCLYYNDVPSSTRINVTSSKLICVTQEDGSKRNESVSCCKERSYTCYDTPPVPITRTFFPGTKYDDEQRSCCFEQVCPETNYWRNGGDKDIVGPNWKLCPSTQGTNNASSPTNCGLLNLRMCNQLADNCSEDITCSEVEGSACPVPPGSGGGSGPGTPSDPPSPPDPGTPPGT